MRRRAAALVLCVLLALQLSLLPARAAERVYFTAVGSYILPLSDNTMPFWSGGYVYVPSSIFTGTAREALGISQVFNSELKRLVLYGGGRSLTFTLSANCALDDDGNAYYPGAVQRNGVVFVPANVVSRYFDLVYSVIEVDHGSMVWLRQPDYSASDKLYADSARYLLNTVYADYIRAKESAPPPAESAPDAPARPSGGEAGEEDAELSGKQIALCLAAGDNAAALLDALSGSGGALFLTPEELERQGDALRRMAAGGVSVGVLADAADPERTVGEQLEAGNAALSRATCGKTRLAYIQNAGPQALQAAEDAGFRCLQPEVDWSGRSLRGASDARALVQRLSGRRGGAAVWLGADVTPSGLRALLSAVREEEGRCAAYTESWRG